MKNEHDKGCEFEYKNTKINKRCCKNNDFKELDRWCLILIPLLFLAFNGVFWCAVYKIDDFPAKSTPSANTLTSSLFLWGSETSQVSAGQQGVAETDQVHNGSAKTLATTKTISTATSTTKTLTSTSISSSQGATENDQAQNGSTETSISSSKIC